MNDRELLKEINRKLDVLNSGIITFFIATGIVIMISTLTLYFK
jgi:hypothetical protein